MIRSICANGDDLDPLVETVRVSGRKQPHIAFMCTDEALATVVPGEQSG